MVVGEKWKSAIDGEVRGNGEYATQMQEDALSERMEDLLAGNSCYNLLEIVRKRILHISHRSRTEERERERAQAYRSSSRSILVPRLIVPVCRYLLLPGQSMTRLSGKWLAIPSSLFLTISFLLFLSEDNSCLTTMNKKSLLFKEISSLSWINDIQPTINFDFCYMYVYLCHTIYI